MTKLDVLSGMKNVALCVAYELDGERLDEPPADADDLARIRPVYETLPGWDADLSSARTIEELPHSVRSYIERVEREARCPIKLLSVGADREHTVTLGNPFV
jgi:adenylosuccinate synthase